MRARDGCERSTHVAGRRRPSMPTPITPATARPCRSAAAPPPSWCLVSSPAGGRPTGRAATSRDALGSPIPWKRLLENAVRHARDGFAVSPGQRRVTAGADALFAASAPAEVRSSFWPVYHPDRFADGRFVQADLAATLAAVSEGGDAEF